MRRILMLLILASLLSGPVFAETQAELVLTIKKLIPYSQAKARDPRLTLEAYNQAVLILAEKLASGSVPDSPRAYPSIPPVSSTLPPIGDSVCQCKGYAGPGGPCYAGPGGQAYAGPGGPAYDGPGGPCYDGPGGPEFSGPGGPAFDGPGGPRYDGPGGPCYSGPGGPVYDGPGGPCYDGPGGPCYSGPGGGSDCPQVCQQCQ